MFAVYLLFEEVDRVRVHVRTRGACSFVCVGVYRSECGKYVFAHECVCVHVYVCSCVHVRSETPRGLKVGGGKGSSLIPWGLEDVGG